MIVKHDMENSMFKIGEFSKLTQVTIRMLRHYDETGLLKPAQIDPITGYRLYSTEQIGAEQNYLFAGQRFSGGRYCCSPQR